MVLLQSREVELDCRGELSVVGFGGGFHCVYLEFELPTFLDYNCI
jgi:hypothetical protein